MISDYRRMANLAQAQREADEHHRAGRHAEALEAYAQVLAFVPDDADALFNRSQLLLHLGRPEEALDGFDRVAALQPSDAGTQRARGVILQSLGRLEEALAAFGAALAAAPEDSEALISRAAVLHALGRYEEAIASYERAQAIRPQGALAHYNESLCRLAIGDYARGWPKYEWRWKWDGFPSPRLAFREPRWLGGENVAGKTILVHAEQGLGDTLQFLRYVPLLAARGAKVVLMVQRALLPLLGGFAGAERVVAAGEALPAADLHVPLLSLPLAFGTTLESVPANLPYLAADAGRVAARREALGAGAKPLVGVCWRGNAQYRSDRERSIVFGKFAPLLETPGLRFVGLQKELTAEEQALLPRNADFANPGESFTATAEIIAALDLVITVDTAFAHLAGALGRPFWVLVPRVPHWCWLRDRRDSPWYPAARVYRQPARGEWSGVLREVAGALAAWRG